MSLPFSNRKLSSLGAALYRLASVQALLWTSREPVKGRLHNLFYPVRVYVPSNEPTNNMQGRGRYWSPHKYV
jgi:hypothetical protein